MLYFILFIGLYLLAGEATLDRLQRKCLCRLNDKEKFIIIMAWPLAYL